MYTYVHSLIHTFIHAYIKNIHPFIDSLICTFMHIYYSKYTVLPYTGIDLSKIFGDYQNIGGNQNIGGSKSGNN